MIKKPIALIMGIVLVLTVISSAFLYMQGEQSGGVSSTDEQKYDHVLDNSYGLSKPISGGARNGSIKKIGGSCFEFSEVILTATLNQSVDAAPIVLSDPKTNSPYVFVLKFPAEIIFTASGTNDFNVYVCWYDEGSGDVVDEISRTFVGNGRNIVINDTLPGYGGEECWIEIESPYGNVRIFRMVVQMVPYTYPSGVSSVVAQSKNLVDFRVAKLRSGGDMTILDNGVVFPAGEVHYFSIPVSLPAGAYTASFIGSNESGDSVGKYSFEYVDGTYSSSVFPGETVSSVKEIKSLRIYKASPNEALKEDLIVKNIQVERGYTSSEYTPFFPDKVLIEIPPAVSSLPEYGVGNDSIYNYLDLTNGTYVQTCKLVDNEVVLLDEPKIYDISYYLPSGSGNVDLYGVGVLVFINDHDVDVPSEVAYRRIIN